MRERVVNSIYVLTVGFMIAVVLLLSMRGEAFEGVVIEIIHSGQTSIHNMRMMVEDTIENNIWKRSEWIDFSGWIAKILDVRSMYKSVGIYVGDNGYIFGPYEEADTDYEYEQIASFKDYLDEKDVDFLFVNCPVKYLDDEEVYRQFGQKSYGNTNADLLIKRLDEQDVDTLDLRKDIRGEGLDSWDMFYRTDHHWTVPTGLWAVRHIAEKLNSNHGFHIDMGLFDNSKYAFTEYKQAWLGEQGRCVAASYVGYDDYTLVEPKYDCDLSIYVDNTLVTEGDFGVMIDKSRFNVETDPYSRDSLHYAYMPFGLSKSRIINNKVDDGKILFLGDSFDYVVIPFLSLSVHEIDSYILRKTDISVRDLVNSNDYDMVIVSYTLSEIGSHKDPDNLNFRMFDLE